MTSNFQLPDHYVEILYGFICVVMEKKPFNYMQFASKYFGNLSNNRSVDKITINESVNLSESSETDSNITLDSKQYASRRKSVAAEPFNPEDINSMDFKLETHEKTEDQIVRLTSICESVSMFKTLNKHDLMKIIDTMQKIHVTPDQEIIKEGDSGDNFYIIESGLYDAYVTQNGIKKKIKSYENEGSFGELALLYNAPRAASIIACSNGILWAVTRHVFRSIVVSKAHKQREIYNKLLEELPILSLLNDFERANVADALVPKECEPGEVIINEGDSGSHMYFILSGKVDIYKTSGGHKEILNSAGPGQYFGELALLSNQPRVASVQATEPTVLAVLDVKSFERLMGPCVEVMKRNMSFYKKNVVNLFTS